MASKTAISDEVKTINPPIGGFFGGRIATMSDSEQEKKHNFFTNKWNMVWVFIPPILLIAGAYKESPILLTIGTFLIVPIWYEIRLQAGKIKIGGDHGHHN